MFRFSIRELMLVTLVVAFGVGWWVDRSNLEKRADKQYEIYWENIRTIGTYGTAEYEFVVDADGRMTARKMR